MVISLIAIFILSMLMSLYTIYQLHKLQDELEKKLTARADRSADLELRQRDLEQLQQIAGDMSQRLEQLDIDASSPDRIRQVQAAVPSPE